MKEVYNLFLLFFGILQVSSMELVQEIHQLLMDREDTCHRTCFSLQLDGNTLDNFAELKSIEGLKEGSIIKVKYSVLLTSTNMLKNANILSESVDK